MILVGFFSLVSVVFHPDLEQLFDIPCIHRYVGLCLWIVYPLAVTSKPSSQGEEFGKML